MVEVIKHRSQTLPTGANGLIVNFNDSSTDDKGIHTYSWSFGDGASSSSANPTHSYVVDGTYTVSLTVSDVEGLTSSKSQTITVTSGSTGGCSGLTEWSLTSSYVPGDKVSYNGNQYTSTWYSTGAQPDVFTQVWTNNGACQ